jgi:hypothetical protein
MTPGDETKIGKWGMKLASMTNCRYFCASKESDLATDPPLMLLVEDLESSRSSASSFLSLFHYVSTFFHVHS